MRYNDFETMSIYTVEKFTSDITVEGYIAEFRDEPHFLELCKQCTNYGKSWGVLHLILIRNRFSDNTSMHILWQRR